MNNEPNIYIYYEQLFPVMAEYGFACPVWFSAVKHDQKTRSADFSRQGVVKYSKVRRMYTAYTTRHNVIHLC